MKKNSSTLSVLAANLSRPFAGLFFACIKCLRPVRHKVTFISRQSDTAPVDFTLLKHELGLQDRSLKVKMLCCSDLSYSKHYMGRLRQTVLELWHIANSSAVVLDSYTFSISYFPQRKNLYVLQMWHALAAIKRFSWQVVDLPDELESRVAHALRMHANYTAALVAGEPSREVFRHAFRIKRARIYTMPLPRLIPLRSPDMNRMDMLIASHRELFTHTPLILYVPEVPDFSDSSQVGDRWLDDLKALAQSVESYGGTLLVKTPSSNVAPLQESDIQSLSSSHLIFNPDIDVLDLMIIVDHVITDYSAAAFEAAVAGKPLWFYLPRHDEYKQNPGLNIDPELYLPHACFSDPHALMDALVQTSLPSARQEQFLQHFVQLPSKTSVTSTKQIARLILQGIQ